MSQFTHLVSDKAYATMPVKLRMDVMGANIVFLRKIIAVLGVGLLLGSPVVRAALQPISYHDVGSGVPLVLIHAFPTDKKLWEAQEAELKNHFRVISLDLLGFGEAEKVSGQAITMRDYADEVKKLLDQLHIQNAIIGGESMGGYVTLAFLAQYPHYIQGVILADTQAIDDSAEAKAKREATAQDVLSHGPTNFIQGFMSKALSPHATPETKQFLQTIAEAQSANAIASALRGMALRQDLSHVLADSSLPVLIITGEQDTLISPQQSQAMHALAKNSKLVIIENADHLANLEQPVAWNKAVIGMFSR